MPATDDPIQIETDRLILRRQRADDAAAYREMWTERDVRVPPHRRIGPDGRPTVEDIAAQIRAERDTANSFFLTITQVDGDVIGYCGLLFVGRGSPDQPELAYELLRRAHGVGYATEAAQALVTWAAETGYRRLCAGVRVWNVASRNVLRKLGFVDSGHVEPDDEFGDSVIMVLAFPTTAVADVVPHRPGTGRRQVVPVSELVDAFAADPAPDPAAWRADLAGAGEVFGPDEPTDPFGPQTR